MYHLIRTVLLVLLTTACTQTVQPVGAQLSDPEDTTCAITVVKYSNSSPVLDMKSDTLLSCTMVDLRRTNVDVYFCNKVLGIPFRLPDTTQLNDKASVEYDRQHRITKWADASGTSYFSYDNMGRIHEILDDSTIRYQVIYDEKNNVERIAIEEGSNRSQVEIFYRY